jgi:hypothetical protein
MPSGTPIVSWSGAAGREGEGAEQPAKQHARKQTPHQSRVAVRRPFKKRVPAEAGLWLPNSFCL